MRSMELEIEANKTAPDKIILKRKGKTFIDTYIYWNDTKQAIREKR